MKAIKFSHIYHKMPLDAYDDDILKPSYLLDVWTYNLEDMSKEFLHHDTHYSGGWYPLPKKGKFLVLIIRTGKIIWMTLRRYTPKKHDYYKGLIGQEIKIMIKD